MSVPVRQPIAATLARVGLSARIVALTLAIAVTGTTQGHAAADGRYAAIVIDANTGETLFSANSVSRRYPASLTKMMTLYITFEAMAAGRITPQTRIPFSAQAAAMPPTKIGVPAGKSITVEQAILALVTKSANDAAAALGEYFAGSEPAFARMMTAKARKLGMSGTVFRNASGLPDPGQFTTARDMATLGLALKAHYPQYFPYFSTRVFSYGRQRMPNHNKLLGRVKGVDGIKTGYTRASGFNLVSSVQSGNRRIVAVVMGGASGASRDNKMVELINAYLPQAKPGKGAPLIAAAQEEAPLKAFAKKLLPHNNAPTPDARPDLEDQDEEVAAFVARADLAKPAAKAAKAAVVPVPKRPVVEIEGEGDIDTTTTASLATAGWVVQVASSPSKAEAAAMLEATRQKAPSILASASPFTVPFDKGGVTYHRARFGGFASKAAAQKACAQLQKKRIDCYAVQN
ncbi:MAG: D-alanyl-D-alanine carboxypeptidase [Rhizobiaceae bacterium]|nr:D-alanyl-D-alanine carboxypeptidase [Rhizobiaceae bacterium]